MQVYVLSSGSSGNGILIEADGTRVLIDAGLNPTAAADRFRQLGGDLFPRGLDAILVTHHHGDHVAHAGPLSRKTKAPVYLHHGVLAPVVRDQCDVREYAAGDTVTVGSVEIATFPLPHDAHQVAVRVSSSRATFAVATDLGQVPEGLDDFLREADAALVEANYCVEMLANGRYPARLKKRISGGRGHLSNDQTADLVERLGNSKLRSLYLGHLSRNNNTPNRALAAVQSRCRGLPTWVVPHGESHRIDPLEGPVARGPQLTLGF